VTVVLVDIAPLPVVEMCGHDDADHIEQAHAHRPDPEDLCESCRWHWPCPCFFHARRALIAAGVPPALWAR
jgi:hypothetical protein